MPHDFNQTIIDEFRANNGAVGGPFEGGRLILLTTTGARTGRPHTTPVGFLPDDGPRILVIASAGGAPRHPDWYHNLLAHPRVTVETGVFTYRAEAEALDGAQRDRLFARAVEANPGWADYQANTTRIIPVVALNPIDGAPNTAAWGDSLKEIHDMFRRELAIVRAEIAASGPMLGAQLRINCLTVCQGLEHHHVSEDGQLLPFLDEHHPELGATVDRMRHEHRAIKRHLDELQRLIGAEGTDPAVVLAEVDRLIGELEVHLDYEETQLIPLLNAATP